MSNFKKFLALVLATLMVASMMVFTAPAASAYAPTGDYADDIALLNAFGVMLGDGVSFNEKGTVTRWQMAILLAKIVTGETGNIWEGEKSDFFTDVTAEHYPAAIDFCAEMGYIVGVGDNKFDPEGLITYQDGLVMLVRLLGYETKTMTYPWGYILTARAIETVDGDLLVGDINTSNKTPLLREEVANLLAKAIYVNLKVGGEETNATLIKTGLKATDLGKATLVATANASIAENEFAAYSKVTFSNGTDSYTVKVANVTKSDDLDMNDYLGFTADLVNVKGTILAKMNNVQILDANVSANNEIKVGDQKFTSFLVYGTAANNVFVANEGTVAKGTQGKVLVCDTENNGIKKADDIVRFIPYNKTTALYVAKDVAVYKDTAKGGWPADMKVDVYYLPHTKNDANCSKDYTNNYEAVLRTDYSSVLQDRLDAKVIGVGAGTSLAGLAHPSGVSVGTDKIALRTEFNTKGSFDSHAKNTSLNVAVIGDIEHGKVTTYGLKQIGNLAFIALGTNVEIETGVAKLTELTATDLKIADTFVTVGFAKANATVNGWYNKFTDVEATAQTLLGKDVEYKKVDGKLVALKLYVEAEDKDTVYLTNPNTATPLFIYIDVETEYKVAADGTIEFQAFNAETFETSTIKVDQINGKKVGTLVNQFGFEVAKGIIGYDSAEDLTELVCAMLATNNNFVFDYLETDAENALVLVTVANKADDVYAITTEKNANVDRVTLGTQVYKNSKGAVISGVDTDGTKTLGFVKYSDSALSDQPFYVGTYDAKVEKTATAQHKYTFAAKYLTITDKTVINVIAKDGMKSFKNITVTEGDLLKLADSGNAFVLNLTNDLVVIVNNDATLADVAKFGTNVTVPTSGGWYTLTWTSQYVSTTAETVNGTTYFNYTFKDLYNLTTGAKETVTISSTEYYSAAGEFAESPAAVFFGDSWKGSSATGLNIDPKNEALVEKDGTNKGSLVDTVALDLYDVYYISNARGSEVVESSIISWGIANGYKFAQIKAGGIINGDANTFKADILKVSCTTDGTYTFTKDGELTSVVSINSTVLNQSANSKADEFNVNAGAANAHAAKLATQREIVAYKLGADGVVTVFGITADDYKGAAVATNGIADGLAKAE